jgi:hypothetical protein
MYLGRATTVASMPREDKVVVVVVTAEVDHRSEPDAGTQLLNRFMAGWRLAG